jgi:hypothetical protein
VKKLFSLLPLFIFFASSSAQSPVYRSIKLYGKYGVVKNNFPNFSVQPVYDEMQFLYPAQQAPGIFSVAMGGKYGIIDGEGKILLPLVYGEIRVIDALREGTYVPRIFCRQDSAVSVFDAALHKLGTFYADIIQDANNEGLIFSLGEFSGTADLDGKILIAPHYKKLRFDNDQCLVAVDKNGKTGFINPGGTTVIPFLYESISTYYGDLFGGELEAKIGDSLVVYNRKGKRIGSSSAVRTEKRLPSRYSYFESGGKYGVKANDKIFLPARFEDVSIIFDDSNLVLFYDGQKRNLYDFNANLIAAAEDLDVSRYDVAKKSFFYLVRNNSRNEKWLAGKSGKKLSSVYSSVEPVANSDSSFIFMTVKKISDTVIKGNLINEKGKELLSDQTAEPNFLRPTAFPDLIVFRFGNSNFLYSLKRGLIGLPAKGNYIPGYFSYINENPGLWKIEHNSKTGIYDVHSNKIILPPVYDYLSFITPRLIRTEAGSKYGLAGVNGELIADTLFDSIEQDSRSGNIICTGPLALRITDAGGKKIILEVEGPSHKEYNGYLLVKTTSGTRYFDNTLKEIDEAIYTRVNADLRGAYYISYKDTKAGLADTLGRIIIQNDYESLEWLDRFRWTEKTFLPLAAKKNGKYGVVLPEKQLIPVVYDSLYAANGKFIGRSGDRLELLDSLGKNINIGKTHAIYPVGNNNFVTVSDKGNFVLVFPSGKRKKIPATLVSPPSYREGDKFFSLFLPPRLDSAGNWIRCKYCGESYMDVSMDGNVLRDSTTSGSVYTFFDNSSPDIFMPHSFFSRKEGKGYKLYNENNTAVSKDSYDTIINPRYFGEYSEHNNLLLLIKKMPAEFRKKQDPSRIPHVYNYFNTENQEIVYVNGLAPEKQLISKGILSQPLFYRVNEDKGLNLEFRNAWYSVVNMGGATDFYTFNDTTRISSIQQVDSNGNPIEGEFFVVDFTTVNGTRFKGGKFGLINSEMKFVIPPVFDDVSLWLNESRVSFGTTFKTQFPDGPPKRETMETHHAVFVKQNGKWGVYTLEGVNCVPAAYDTVVDFIDDSHHYYEVRKPGNYKPFDITPKFVLFDHGGKNVLSCTYSGKFRIASALLVAVENKHGVWDLKTEKWLLETVCDSIALPLVFRVGDPHSDLYYAEPVYETEFVSIHNLPNEVFTDPYVCSVAEDLPFAACKDGKWGLVTRDGKSTGFNYTSVRYVKDAGVFEARTEKGTVTIDKNLRVTP